MEQKVGASLVVGKTIFRGHNRKKTHTKFANPNKHVRTSLHAELDCLIKATNDLFPTVLSVHGDMYIFRETADGKPALARPCEHCMKFLKKAGVDSVTYSIAEPPYIRQEKI